MSGYVFRSMKDVRRYLQTGDIGRLAYKPPDKDEIDADLEDSKITVSEYGVFVLPSVNF